MVPLLLCQGAAHKVLKSRQDNVIRPRCLCWNAVRVRHPEKVGDLAAIEAVPYPFWSVMVSTEAV